MAWKLLDKKDKMKILHIITSLDIGGASKNTIFSAAHQNKKNHSEIVSGPTGKENLVNEARKKGIKVKIIKGMSNRIRPLEFISAISSIKKYIEKNKFDVVHTHSSVAGILGRIAAKKAGVPVIVHTVHGWGLQEGMNPFKKWVYVMLERYCAGFTDKLIVVSKFNIDKGLKHKIGSMKQYQVIYSGIPINKFSRKINKTKKRKELGLDDNPVVCMVGRLDKQKNPTDFIKAASIVSREIPDAQFIIVGGGPLESRCRNLIKQLGLENIHILGFRDDVAEILQISDIFVLTSLWEGLPRLFPESMAAKKPIVATNVDGAPEAIKNGRNGFIVQTHKPKLIAEKVLYLLNNPAKAKDLGKEGLKMVEKFSLKKMLDDIDRLYKELAKKRKTGK